MAAKRAELIEEINEAFARYDREFLLAHVTEDFRWTMVGDRTLHGREAFAKELSSMEPEGTASVSIHHIITHGLFAVGEGEMKMTDTFGTEKRYAFCDVYKFDKYKDGKMKELTSYVIELEEDEEETNAGSFEMV